MINGGWSKGNRVRRVGGNCNGMEIGDEDIIASWGPDSFNLKKFGSGHNHEDLELIPNSQKTELKGGKEKMGKVMNYEQFNEYVKKNGITKARTIEDFRSIPRGTTLFFGIDSNHISTYNRYTDEKNVSLKYSFDYSFCGYWKSEYVGEFELIETPSNNICKMTTKKIYSVLILDKKKGTTTKDAKVTAANEQEAILKTFGVDAENTFIKIVELGEYEEDKPIKAIIETIEKPKKE